MIMFGRILDAYWLLIVASALALFDMSRWLLDKYYLPGKFYFWISLCVCIFNLVACYKNVRLQIILGRIAMAAVTLFPILVMSGNLNPNIRQLPGEIGMVCFVWLGMLAIPIAQLGELAVHLILNLLGVPSSLILGEMMSLKELLIFESGRYVLWICIHWFWFVPFIMRLLRRRYGRLPAVVEITRDGVAS